MQLFPENYEVTIGFAFTDYNGSTIAPTMVEAALYDGNDERVHDFGEVAFDLDDGKVDIVIPAQFNDLGEELNASRILRVKMTTPAGVIKRSSSYIVEGEIRLAVMQNSFQTIEASELLARDIPNLAGFIPAARDDRFAALITAYHRLTRIPFRVVETGENNLARREFLILREAPRGDDSPDLNLLGRGGLLREFPLHTQHFVWSTMTPEDFHSLPLDFRRKLRMAQIAEANEILENDVVARKHRAGIISETVGESSVMLRGGRLDLGIGRAALEFLTGHVYYSFKASRA